MNDYIISRNADGDLYAYCTQRFWRCMSWQDSWLESPLTAQAYTKAHAKDSELTPEQFFEDYKYYTILKDGDIGSDLIQALLAVAQGEQKPAVAASEDKPLAFIRDDHCPAFDYSGLAEQTIETLHLAENGYLHGKKLAERGLVYMGDNIALAHDALCGTVVAQCDNGRFAKKEDTFRAWCLSIGITKDSAYRLLQVSALMDGSSPRQRKILESLPPTLLYAVAKPSAPQELVEKVKSGEVSSNKEYQALNRSVKSRQ